MTRGSALCAVIFGLMGGVPLVGGMWALREARSGRSTGTGPGRLRLASTPRGGFELHAVDRRPRGDPAGGSVADRLERLVRLRDAGDLTDTEFEAAKRATLDEAGA